MSVENVQKRRLKNCDIYIGTGLETEFLPRLNAVFEEGAIALLYQNDSEPLVSIIAHELKRFGYRVFAKCVDRKDENSNNVPEFVRYIFCVGDDEVIHIAKQISSELEIDWSLFIVAPTNDDVMCQNPPKQVFIDKNVLLNCRNEQLGAGYGILLSSKVTAFENEFMRLVAGGSAFDCESVDVSQIDRCELVYNILQISCGKTTMSGVELTSKLMRALALSKGKTPRLDGEYRFLAGSVLCNLYSSFLGSPSIDCAPPPCLCADMDKISSLSINIANNLKCIDFFDVSSYFRISYILSEYRLDLLEKLACVDMHSAKRFWRRLYGDAGYWLKSEITASEVLWCIYLAGAMSDGLLGYMYTLGMMKKFA